MSYHVTVHLGTGETHEFDSPTPAEESGGVVTVAGQSFADATVEQEEVSEDDESSDKKRRWPL